MRCRDAKQWLVTQRDDLSISDTVMSPMRKAMPGRKIDKQFCVARSRAKISGRERYRTYRQRQCEALRPDVANCFCLGKALFSHLNCLVRESLKP